MKIFGYPPIPSPTFIQIHSLQEIDTITANHIVYFTPSIDKDLSIGRYCHEHQIAYAILTEEITTFLLYTNLSLKYCITHNVTLQSIATQYLLDTQILHPISSLEEIPALIQSNLDGAIFL